MNKKKIMLIVLPIISAIATTVGFALAPELMADLAEWAFAFAEAVPEMEAPAE